MKNRIIIIFVALIFIIIVVLAAEILYSRNTGIYVPAPTIPREPKQLGSGPPLTYVVMGDSTSVGQGAKYSASYAVDSANHLARTHSVKFVNVGISGATAETVLKQQLKKAESFKPDVVVLAVGGNDARKFVSGKSLQDSLQKIINGLRASNCNVRIVVTGSPAVDSVTRFPVPLKQIMGLRSRQINNAFEPVIAKNHLTLAPIALKTRQAFLDDPSLLSSDKFHPNARGYALWKPVINKALDQALALPKSDNCK